MANEKHIERKPADRTGKSASVSPSEISATGELTDSDMDAVNGGAGHCATGKHFAEATITHRKST